MALEESTVIPLARKHLTAEDWSEIGAASVKMATRVSTPETDLECRDLFSRIVNLAPPP